jgi:hypothetical protein
VLLAGDAAHVHFPMGGQGMNLGVQDAHNLAWRLTAAVRAQRGRPAERLPDALLDGYEAERRPVGERVLEDVRAQMALVAATGADGVALRARFEALLAEHAEVNLQYARRLSGLDVRYPTPDATDPRAGERVPDLELDLSAAAPAWTGPAESLGTTDPAEAPGPARLYELLRAIGPGRFVHLIVSDPAPAAPAARATPTAPEASAAAEAPDDAVTLVAGKVLGPDWAVRAGWGRPEAVTIRPDGHIAGISPLSDAPAA